MGITLKAGGFGVYPHITCSKLMGTHLLTHPLSHTLTGVMEGESEGVSPLSLQAIFADHPLSFAQSGDQQILRSQASSSCSCWWTWASLRYQQQSAAACLLVASNPQAWGLKALRLRWAFKPQAWGLDAPLMEAPKPDLRVLGLRPDTLRSGFGASIKGPGGKIPIS